MYARTCDSLHEPVHACVADLAVDIRRLSSNVSPEEGTAHRMVALVCPATAGGPLLAAVDGSESHYLVYKGEFTIGRTVHTELTVQGEQAAAPDIDLSLEGSAGRVSRTHAVVRRDARGLWSLTNVGCPASHLCHFTLLATDPKKSKCWYFSSSSDVQKSRLGECSVSA